MTTGWSSLFILLAGACAGNYPREHTRPWQECDPAQVAAQPFEWSGVTGLAGSYRLSLRDSRSQKDRAIFAIQLEVNDSTLRYPPRRVGYYPGERPLVGHADQFLVSGTERRVHRLPVAMIDSTLYVGEFDGLDAAAFLLLPRRTGPGGFSGSWRWDGGMEITVDSITGRQIVDSGSFCAVHRQEGGV